MYVLIAVGVAADLSHIETPAKVRIYIYAHTLTIIYIIILYAFEEDCLKCGHLNLDTC